MTEDFKSIFSPELAAGSVSMLLVISGLYFMKNLKHDSPIMPYILQVLGLTFILPVVLLMSIVIKLPTEAVTGLLGTIIGYVFGTSQLTYYREVPPKRSRKAPPSNNSNYEGEYEEEDEK